MAQNTIYWNNHIYKNGPGQKHMAAASSVLESCFMHDCLFSIPDDQAIAPAMRNGIYEYFEISQLKKVLHPTDVFIDVGACIGIYSIIASKAVGEGGHVIAIEPNDCKYILWNAKENDCQNIKIINAAAGDKYKIGYLNTVPENYGDSCVDTVPSVSGRQVPIITIDQAVASRHRVSAIKIDVQGYELEVLRGAHATINQNKRIYILLEYSPEHLAKAGHSMEEMLDYIFDVLGFRVFVFDTPGVQVVDGKLLMNFQEGYILRDVTKLELLAISKDMSGIFSFMNLWLVR